MPPTGPPVTSLPAVTIVDRVTLPRVEAPAWRARLHAAYRPRAEARGYDAWFDPEVPEHVVEPELAHLFARYDVPVL